MQPLQITQLTRYGPHSKGSDDMLEPTVPVREGIETEPEEILRWEDDGGNIINARGKRLKVVLKAGREEHF